MLLQNPQYPILHLEKVNAWIQYEQIMICKYAMYPLSEEVKLSCIKSHILGGGRQQRGKHDIETEVRLCNRELTMPYFQLTSSYMFFKFKYYPPKTHCTSGSCLLSCIF